MKIYNNPNDLPGSVVQSRIRTLDRQAVCGVYDVYTLDDVRVVYAAVDSTASDQDVIAQLSTPVTQEEKDEYQNTINNLLNIENAVNPTNAQVIAAVKYLARTLRFVIKLFIRYY